MEFDSKQQAIDAAVEMATTARDAGEAVTYSVHYVSGPNHYRVTSAQLRNLPLMAVVEADRGGVTKRVMK